MSCALVLTRQMAVDLARAAVEDYRSSVAEGSTHEEALDYVESQAAEGYVCLSGECNH